MMGYGGSKVLNFRLNDHIDRNPIARLTNGYRIGGVYCFPCALSLVPIFHRSPIIIFSGFFCGIKKN
jgi:hypothetical protein